MFWACIIQINVYYGITVRMAKIDPQVLLIHTAQRSFKTINRIIKHFKVILTDNINKLVLILIYFCHLGKG